MKKIAFFIAALLCAPVFAQELPKIAVYVTGGVSDNEKNALGTRMLAALVNSGRYKGIERSSMFLAEIEKEHIQQRSGAVDNSQISKVGKQFGVKFICIADITPAYGGFQVSARIVNVETAEVDFIGESTSPLETIDDLSQASDRVVKNMFNGQTVSKSEPAEKPDGSLRKPNIRISAGAGGFFAGDFGGGIEWGNGERLVTPRYGGGGYIFVDAVYAEIFAGYAASGGKWRSAAASDQNALPDMQSAYLNFGAFLKYPFAIGNVNPFPLLGIDYEASISGKLKFANDVSEYVFDEKNKRPAANSLSALWLKFGGGLDVDLNKRIYMRGELLYGIRTVGAFEKERVDAEKKKYPDDKVKNVPGNGLTFRAGAGIIF